MASAATARISRAVLKELLKASPEQHCTPSACNHQTWQHIKSMIRSNDQNYTVQDLQSYLYYLRGSRQHREVLAKYQGKGERSVEESANLVGLTLPDKEQDSTVSLGMDN